MEEKKLYYYRIFDDRGEKNYIKTTLDKKTITSLIERFEKENSEFFNIDFLKHIQQHDPEADLIEITRLYY